MIFENGNPIGPDVMTEEIKYLITVLKNAWAYAEWNRERIGLDLDGLLERYLERVQKPLAYAAYFDTLRLLAAELQEGHVTIRPPSAAGIPVEGHLALELCFYGSRVYIRKVKNPEHWDPPPAPGDQIVSINGRPASSVVARATSRMPAST